MWNCLAGFIEMSSTPLFIYLLHIAMCLFIIPSDGAAECNFIFILRVPYLLLEYVFLVCTLEKLVLDLTRRDAERGVAC
jgi:hypothetical protein